MKQSKIPITNIYYLFCYAWQHVEERDLVPVEALDEHEKVHDLFGLLLAEGVFKLVRAGLDRGYLDQHEDLSGVRGKINVSDTMQRALRPRGRVACEFQELSYDILHNQILKTTLQNLLRLSSLHKDIHSKVRKAYISMSGINSIHLSAQTFNRVQLDRNRQYYRLLLSVCRLLYEQLLINENTGENLFEELNEEKMHRLFEQFITEFYRKEQSSFRVNHQGRTIKWDDKGSSPENLEMLPNMQADVILDGDHRRIILDAKYYREALSGQFDKKIRSDHLYQLTAYLRNREKEKPDGPRHEGMLLYPTVGEKLNVDLYLEGFSVKARTIDLAQDWRQIHNSMLHLIGVGTNRSFMNESSSDSRLAS